MPCCLLPGYDEALGVRMEDHGYTVLNIKAYGKKPRISIKGTPNDMVDRNPSGYESKAFGDHMKEGQEKLIMVREGKGLLYRIRLFCI